VQGCGKVVAKRSVARGEVDDYDAGAAALGSSSEGPSGAVDADTRAAGVLVALVRAAPDGQMSAAQLCSRLYRKCPEARDIIQKSRGIKGFIKTNQLECKVEFVPDQVCKFVKGCIVCHMPLELLGHQNAS
jgi:hypothetical protein